MSGYQVTVLEFAYGENVPLSFYLGMYADPESFTPVHPFTMTLVQGNGMNILIDTGVDPDDPVKQEILKGAGVGHAHTPREVLAQVGVTPEDINAVILTHAHFDHAGALDCYPNAKFYIQKGEYLGWTEFKSNPKFSAMGALSMDPNDIERLHKLEQAGRLELIDGDKIDLFPGITLSAAAFGHTYGCQMVLIDTGDMTLVHVGDVANRPENLQGTETFPFYIPNTNFAVGSAYYTLADYDRIMLWAAGNIDRVIMTHDGTRRDRFQDCVGELGLGIYRYC